MVPEKSPLISIPFNRPFVAGREYEYIRQAIDNGQISGDGPFTRKCQLLLEQLLNGSKTLLTTSCTDALEMSALLLNLAPGDEVIVPSFTFVSTANAFLTHGARPVFADVRPDTLNIDESKMQTHIGPRTKAIVVVHYAGVGCEMDCIMEVAKRHQLAVIEDNAHGLFGAYKGKNLGNFGVLATLSFHETKNISCGEGGALVINAPEYIDRAEIVREKGTDRSRFFRKQVDKYTWVDHGSSFLPSDLLAAFLYAQLEARETIQRIRRRIWDFYLAGLSDWCRRHEVRLPTVPAYCQQSYHMFYLLMRSVKEREMLIAHLRRRGILSVFHYLPLHVSPMGLQLGGRPGLCPVAEDASERLVRLPFFNGMTEAIQTTVIEAIHEFHP
jgi:dTDP-4-amino-4,6-dideoxygalactose transaminase